MLNKGAQDSSSCQDSEGLFCRRTGAVSRTFAPVAKQYWRRSQRSWRMFFVGCGVTILCALVLPGINLPRGE